MTSHADTIRNTGNPVARTEVHLRRATVADAAPVRT
jgi:hypothetical protein